MPENSHRAKGSTESFAVMQNGFWAYVFASIALLIMFL